MGRGEFGRLGDDIFISERRPWRGEKLIILVGPGGAGKTTLASILAQKLNYGLIDLDEEFCSKIGEIDRYIHTSGYPIYKAANSQLAKSLVSNLTQSTIFVTSSGFLSLDNPAGVLAENSRFLKNGYSISLLPHADIQIASRIIVDRQLRRGLYQDVDRQRQTILERFPLYKAAGDMLVISAVAPIEIASAIANRLEKSETDHF